MGGHEPEGTELAMEPVEMEGEIRLQRWPMKLCKIETSKCKFSLKWRVRLRRFLSGRTEGQNHSKSTSPKMTCWLTTEVQVPKSLAGSPIDAQEVGESSTPQLH